MKTAAIWARISGTGQQSLPSQVAEVRPWLESLGWTVADDRIITVDWTSKDILRCPEMKRLLAWVTDRKVDAVGSLHLDRFAARPGQIAQIFDIFKQAGAELLLKQTPLPTGLMGELVGLVITIGKEMSVERANEGAKKGLHDRAKLRRLPVNFRKPYGYSWERDTLKLIPDEKYEWAYFICHQVLAGTPSRAICHKLGELSIPTPMGKTEWGIQTIMNIVKNPLYGGRFYAIRSEAVEPHNRRSDTYGKSSGKTLPIDQWEYLPEVTVMDPPLNWDEWWVVQRRLEQNKILARRNAKHDYFLRGLITCDVHNRRFRGSPYHQSWKYMCPIGDGCRKWLNGPDTEDRAKAVVQKLLDDPDIVVRTTSHHEAQSLLEKELSSLEAKYHRTLNALVELERRHIDGSGDDIHKISDEVYIPLKRQYRAKSECIVEHSERVRQQLHNLRQQTDALDSLRSMRRHLAGNLRKFGNTEWRHLFAELAMMVHSEADGSVVCHFNLPYHLALEKTANIVSSTA